MQHRILMAGVLGALILALDAPAQRNSTSSDRIREGTWKTKAHIPEGFVVHESRHYQIQSECGEEKAERLADHMEKMFEVYVKMFPPGKSGFTKKPIKLLKDRDSYIAYGGSPGSAGYYTYGAREMVCYDTGRWMDEEAAAGPTTGEGKPSRREIMEALMQKSQMDLLGVMSHEGWHQYFHWYVVSMVSLPSWINEGMGDYFYAARPLEGEKTKLPVQLGRLNQERLPIIRMAVKQNRQIPFEQILRYSQAEYYANPSICYAQGWAMCQFLMHHEDKRLRKVIPHFVSLVRDDTNMESVTAKAFRGVDLAALDIEFKEWVMGLGLAESEQLEQDLDAALEEEIRDAIEGASNPPGGSQPPADGGSTPPADGGTGGTGDGSQN